MSKKIILNACGLKKQNKSATKISPAISPYKYNVSAVCKTVYPFICLSLYITNSYNKLQIWFG